jgi:protein SCO1
MKKFLTAVLALGFAGSLALVMWVKLRTQTSASAEALADTQAGRDLKALMQVPDFAFVNQRLETNTLATLSGHVWVANFIFTQCKTICPLMTTKMVQLQREVADPNFRFVSFSVDPTHDSPEVLRAYAQQWAPQETRWNLMSTDAVQLEKLTSGLRVTAQKVEGQADPILHSSVFLLINAQGQVLGIFDSDNRQDFARLLRAAQNLSSHESPAKLPTTGVGLYHSLSCANCHENAALAPSLAGLLNQKRELDTGLVATADEAYVRESIVSPQAKKVRGYALQMPAYDTLTPTQLSTLVEYLKEIPGEPKAESGRLEQDVVCHMKVRVVEETLQATTDAGTFYFCSSYCRERFVTGPQLFIH